MEKIIVIHHINSGKIEVQLNPKVLIVFNSIDDLQQYSLMLTDVDNLISSSLSADSLELDEEYELHIKED